MAMDTGGKTAAVPVREAWDAWRELAPAALERQNPFLILSILAVADQAKGIFQMELQTRLEVNQSYLSKLIAKLVSAAWVEVSAPETGRGRSRVKTTAEGRKVLARFRVKPAPPRAVRGVSFVRGIRRPTRQRGQLNFERKRLEFPSGLGAG